MTFAEALEAMKAGRCARRRSWVVVQWAQLSADRKYFQGRIDADYDIHWLAPARKTGWYQLSFKLEDMLAEDWELQ